MPKKKPLDIRTLTEKARKDYQKDREYEANKKILKYEQRQQSYDNSFAGKISKGVTHSLKFIKHPTRTLYETQNRPPIARSPYEKEKKVGRAFSGRGRPVGTTKYFDPRTGQPIGVYEYRKVQSHLHRMETLQAQRTAGLNPYEQRALQQADAQQRYQQQNIESRPIPDTTGQVNMRSIHQEADAYAHLVD